MKVDIDHHVWMIVVLITAMLANGNAGKYTAMYTMGDSLTDPGNNKYFVDSMAKADFLPYGIDFGEGPTGRFCNGKILVDFIAEMLGLPLVPSYADVRVKGASILTGVNYASAGAGILPDTGYRFGRVIPLAEQVKKLKETVDELRRKWNEVEVSKYLARAVLFVDIGANDYLNNYLRAEYYPASRIYNLRQFAHLLVSRYRDCLLEIQSIGLRKMWISEASPIGCGPLRIEDRKCNATLNKMITTFNKRLKLMVQDLSSNYPQSQFTYIPTYQAALHIFDNAEAYGFKVKDAACCGESKTNGTKPLCFRDSIPCPRREEYLFWDDAHPSEAANRIIARFIYNATL